MVEQKLSNINESDIVAKSKKKRIQTRPKIMVLSPFELGASMDRHRRKPPSKPFVFFSSLYHTTLFVPSCAFLL
jgi:hypothetical protein